MRTSGSFPAINVQEIGLWFRSIKGKAPETHCRWSQFEGAGIHKLQRGVYWLVLELLWAGSSARFQVLVQSEQCTGRNALGLLGIERPPYARKPSRCERGLGGRVVAG